MLKPKFDKGTKVVGKDVNTGKEKRGIYIRETIGNRHISMVSINGSKGFIRNAKEDK